MRGGGGPNGTSPRMRGKRIITIIIAHDVGNIPAYAGKTGLVVCDDPEIQEHPRVCGENPY